jgi:hypothetical protein
MFRIYRIAYIVLIFSVVGLLIVALGAPLLSEEAKLPGPVIITAQALCSMMVLATVISCVPVWRYIFNRWHTRSELRNCALLACLLCMPLVTVIFFNLRSLNSSSPHSE